MQEQKEKVKFQRDGMGRFAVKCIRTGGIVMILDPRYYDPGIVQEFADYIKSDPPKGQPKDRRPIPVKGKKAVKDGDQGTG
jgi:hypothetical protein